MEAKQIQEQGGGAGGVGQGHLSQLNVWGLSFGCIVGWGAFVMPGTTFLPGAGPAGTVIAVAIGLLAMLVIAANYHFMLNRFPDEGGAFTFSLRQLGHDAAFLCSWFLALTYISCMWANITALALISRYLLDNSLALGFHYHLAGYDIFIGEVVMEILVLVLCGILCLARKRLVIIIHSALAILLLASVCACFLGVWAHHGWSLGALRPGFPAGGGRLRQIVQVLVVMPWAFVGFETISNAVTEFRFSTRHSLRVMALALLAGASVYVLLAFAGAFCASQGGGGWQEYLSAHPEVSELKTVPVFEAVRQSLGGWGLALMGVGVFAAIVTGIIGFFLAGTRLLYSMAGQGILPPWFKREGANHTPRNAMLFVMCLSIGIPFLGRTAVNWVVDVLSFGAVIAYAYTSVAAFLSARESRNRAVQATGVLGLALAVFFGVSLLAPNLWSKQGMQAEAYLILTIWCILGLAMFRYLYRNDGAVRYGKSLLVSVTFFFLVFFSAVMWMRQSIHGAAAQMSEEARVYQESQETPSGAVPSRAARDLRLRMFRDKMSRIQDSLMRRNMIPMMCILVAVFAIFALNISRLRREREMMQAKSLAEERSRARTRFFASLSHDIRTPMNAVMGFTTLARQSQEMGEVQGYLGKIDLASRHLLLLVNDILELARLESGKFKLTPEDADLGAILLGIRDIFQVQMEQKGIQFSVEVAPDTVTAVHCDRKQLTRVLMNLVGNAYKFTPRGGRVLVRLEQVADAEGGDCVFEFTVRDTGIGMTQAFAAKLFDAFERESSDGSVEGTGLGLAITKGIVDAMQGTIAVRTKLQKGTEFTVTLRLPKAMGLAETAPETQGVRTDFTGCRILIVDDVLFNRQLAHTMLAKKGFEVEEAENGEEALKKVEAAEAGHYTVILMDVLMPVMDGHEATRRIRALEDRRKASVPIVGLSASASEEDRQIAMRAGMNDYVAKPLRLPKLMQTLNEAIGGGNA